MRKKKFNISNFSGKSTDIQITLHVFFGIELRLEGSLLCSR